MVLPFINRDNELACLNQEYAQKRSALIVIYGRRRIGKTTLIKEFIKGKTALYLIATEESDRPGDGNQSRQKQKRTVHHQ
jgi:AAA+ ATPase superfamily predicted ATPase